jgi:uncharacterized protein (DUF4415 family)
MSERRLAAIKDKDIDFSDIPELGEAFFRNAQLVLPPKAGKAPVTLRLDRDVLRWFKSQGKGHLTRMNAVLRAYVATQRGSSRSER